MLVELRLLLAEACSVSSVLTPEPDLAIFFHHFGPLARSVYVYASSITPYYASIRNNVGQLVVRQANWLD